MKIIEKKGAYDISFVYNTCKNKFEFNSISYANINTCNRITL